MKTLLPRTLLPFAAVVFVAANTQAGRWLSRDPIQEGAGFVQRDPIPGAQLFTEPRNEPYLYVFIANDSINSIDPLGLWQVDRKGGAKAPALAEAGDTVADLADLIGLNPADFPKWLTPVGATTMPTSSGQRLTACDKFKIPNTVVAYWAGNLGGIGRWYVRWNSSIKYLGKRGFHVDEQRHQRGTTMALQNLLTSHAGGKELHGLYFWGHGNSQFLVSKQGDVLVDYSTLSLNYKMALGLVFACYSNSGQSVLMSGSGAQIWKGFPGVLVPWPFRHYHAKHYIHHGQQETH